MWDNTDDLELYAVAPNGEIIYYNNTRSSCGGTLDVDMNAGQMHSTEPIANIFWESAPTGHYKVLLL